MRKMSHSNQNQMKTMDYTNSDDCYGNSLTAGLLQQALETDDPDILDIHIDNTQDDIPSVVGYILRTACMKDAVNIVKFILRKLGRKQKNNLNKSLLEPLIVHGGNREIVKCLLDAGICRRGLTENGDTDILLAVRSDKSEILEVLLKSVAAENEAVNRINEPNSFGVFPLFLAVQLKRITCLKLLIEAGADINQKIENPKTEQDLHGLTEVIDLYEDDHIYKHDKLAKVSVGDSLLHIVLKRLGLRVFYNKVQVYFAYETIFELLLSKNFDIAATDGKGHSLMDEAIISLCDNRILHRLIEKGCKVLLPNPYHYACFEDSVERLEVIKSFGFDVSSGSSETQFSPLFIACLDQNVKVVTWLLENGAHPTVYADSRVLSEWIANVNKFKDDLVLDPDHYATRMPTMTPLHFTLLGSMNVFMSAIPIVEALCHHGVNINARTSSGETPLFYAARDLLGEDNLPFLPAYFRQFGPEESLFILLIQAGADPDIGTDSGKFPIHFCIPEVLSRIALMFLEVSTNLSKYIAVAENDRNSNGKVCHISDLSFLPMSKSSLKALVQNPRKLKVLCRKTILKACRGRHVNSDNCLKALPQTVLNYVTLKHLNDNDWYQNPDTL